MHLEAETDELLEELCSKICTLTAGLPRMVHACFEALCRQHVECIVLHSSAEIDDALERAYLTITAAARSLAGETCIGT